MNPDSIVSCVPHSAISVRVAPGVLTSRRTTGYLYSKSQESDHTLHTRAVSLRYRGRTRSLSNCCAASTVASNGALAIQALGCNGTSCSAGESGTGGCGGRHGGGSPARPWPVSVGRIMAGVSGRPGVAARSGGGVAWRPAVAPGLAGRLPP